MITTSSITVTLLTDHPTLTHQLWKEFFKKTSAEVSGSHYSQRLFFSLACLIGHPSQLNYPATMNC